MNIDHVLERIAALRQLNVALDADKYRIRAVLDGGEAAIRVLLGSHADIGTDELPVAPLLDSGLRKFAQRLQTVPSVKVPTRGDDDSDKERERAAKVGRIVRGYDDLCRLDMQLPQLARWLVGYGYAVWVMRVRHDANGVPYPYAELRDPFDVMPGAFGPDQRPHEVGIRRTVPPETLAELYPDHASLIMRLPGSQQAASSRWESQGGGVLTVEYISRDGYTLTVPEADLVIDHTPNVLYDQPPFVFVKRFTFNRLFGAYKHVLGIMTHMAKLNILALIAAEDSTFRETNVIGEMIGDEYERGRFAVNFFAPGSRIERPTGDLMQQTWAQIDRLERHLRIGASYPVQADGISPMSFTTGRGVDALSEPIDAEFAEYQKIIADGLEQLDQMRLAWDEAAWPDAKKIIGWGESGEQYVPSKDIAGRYRTRRVYGIMSGWDEPTKIVTGLQLLQAGILDRATIREQLHGVDDSQKIADRIIADEAERHLLTTIQQMAAQGDPKAMMTLVQIWQNPSDADQILRKFFTPEEPQPTPEEAAVAAGEQPGGPGQNPLAALFGGGGGGGAPPPVTTVLSRLTGSGGEGGVQTVGRLP